MTLELLKGKSDWSGNIWSIALLRTFCYAVTHLSMVILIVTFLSPL
jgi:hypothetical protein